MSNLNVKGNSLKVKKENLKGCLWDLMVRKDILSRH